MVEIFGVAGARTIMRSLSAWLDGEIAKAAKLTDLTWQASAKGILKFMEPAREEANDEQREIMEASEVSFVQRIFVKRTKVVRNRRAGGAGGGAGAGASAAEASEAAIKETDGLAAGSAAQIEALFAEFGEDGE